MLKKFAVGMVIKDRWNLTHQSLQSLLRCNQPRHEYDLFLIDNGSSQKNRNNLKDFVRSESLPVKGLILMPEASISQAWNLVLALARNYDYRTKMDNDMVLHGTISVVVPQKSVTSDPKAGAPMSGPPLIGLGSVNVARRNRKKVLKERAKQRNSSFLGHMQTFATENKVDLVSLIPVSPGQNFKSMRTEIVAATWKGLPYLFGACMLISKKCFDTIGYFDERLPRRIDVDYSQRAIRVPLNIGYHDWYYATHIGAGHSTEIKKLIDQKYEYARQVERQKGPLQGFAPSVWQNSIESIEKHIAKNKILNLV